MSEIRYQHATLSVRCVRWLRHMPIAYLRGLGNVLLWACRGCPVFPHSTVATSASLMMRIPVAQAQVMGLRKYKTMAEFREEIDLLTQPQRAEAGESK